MNQINRFVKFLCAVSMVLCVCLIAVAQLDPPRQTRGLRQYQTQEAHDAVQDQRLQALERTAQASAIAIEEIQAKINWILGGLAGFGGLLTALHIIQLKRTR